MEGFNRHERPHKPSVLFQPSSPPRVSTDPEPLSKKSHLHNLHHHHRHKHHHNRSSSHAKDAKQAVKSAVTLQPPTSFGDLLKQASRNKDEREESSIRESAVRSELDSTGNGNLRIGRIKTVRPDDVGRERLKVKAREEELRQSLQALSDQSLKTSRFLDDTYYSLLEKVSTLRQTIGSLQELSNLTKDLHENFRTDTQELIDEVQGQFEGFNNFEVQQAQADVLEERIKNGKEKAYALTVKLDEARKRVETRAQAEAESDARTTRRLRLLWVILTTLTAISFIAILFQQLKPTSLAADHRPALNFELRAKLVDAPIPDDAKEAIAKPYTPRLSHRLAPPSLAAPSLEEDHRLGVFDEL